MPFDVLVIGSGASGLAAAVSAERAGASVALAAKGSLQSCNSAKAQGGIQAAFGDDDSPEQHAEDVWKSSHETADRDLVTVLTSEAPSAIHWLEELGVEFTRERAPADGSAFAAGAWRGRRSRPDNGGYRLARCGGASRKRLLQVGDRTGHAITKALREAFEAGSGTALPKSPLVSLEPRENGWCARCGEHLVLARTVVLAAGGRCFKEATERGELSTNHPGATGEVTLIAVGVGARARDLDALQYHPNGGAWPANMQGYSIPETTRAYGAVLLNADGEEFTDSLGTRDTVSQAIFDEVAKGKGVETPDGRPAVYLDTTRIAEHDAEISLPYMLRRYRSGGIDPLREPILTYPVLHYQNGGLVIDEHAETTVEGLYACGEIAGGTHGRNRMMGNSLLECCVFGRRAGRAAAEKAKAA
jgi:aspartate oxidase